MADSNQDICNRIDSILDARNYIRRRLGHPVICVEIADEQLNDIICDTIQDADRYLYGEGNYRDYMVFSITSGVSDYQMDNTITDVVEFDYTSLVDGINVLHSPTHMLLYNDWVVNGNYPGGGYSEGASSLVGYDLAMTYLKEVESQFAISYNADFHEPSGILKILPTPKKSGTGLLKVWKKSDVNDMMQHPLVKKLMVARAMMQWGLHLKKYQVTLPGGGTTNGDGIYSDGLAMEEKTMERLMSEGEFPQFFVG